jgi:hypothetical protein
MPLRDPFHPPLDNRRSWDELHGAWPTVIVMALNKSLPPRYVAVPQIHLGAYFEIDVASFEEEEPAGLASEGGEGEGGVATAVWAPPQPTLDIAADLPDQDEYEVLVYDTRHHRRLVATVEIISPSNKDRPESRRLFVAECAALTAADTMIREGTCVRRNVLRIPAPEAHGRDQPMNTHLQGMQVPTDSVLDITIHIRQPLNITAFSARQRVTQYVMQELSTQLGGDTPDLTVGERVYWSVPVVFTLPGKGLLGRVGTLRVDAGTGELLTDPQTEQEIMNHAEQLAQRATLSTGA